MLRKKRSAEVKEEQIIKIPTYVGLLKQAFLQKKLWDGWDQGY